MPGKPKMPTLPFSFPVTCIQNGKETMETAQASKAPEEWSIDDLAGIVNDLIRFFDPARPLKGQAIFYESGGRRAAATLTATMDGISITIGPTPMKEETVYGLILRGQVMGSSQSSKRRVKVKGPIDRPFWAG